ncbi:3-hydroxybutyrate oligomer hydrolase family protein [uncultured Azohydromonas sp.]|uniref:3-hydroxybutyrate oligomer hydrolase family protein n=1 Tax=uncultured Azohydromonas sp. TaxID=487342 RepID=UPI00262F0777|nr:3-hydroxybutyrate oligomer hydrolase family protein [uncultured Azohydromonas sp.]
MSVKTVHVPRRLPAAAAAALLCLQLAGCWDDDDEPINDLPAGITDISRTAYTATTPSPNTAPTSEATQDLLTGGLGKSGLAGAAPTYANAEAPTRLELRRHALYSNYRGLVDVTANGGYGTVYGPNVDLAGNATASEGLIPGVEYIGVLDNAEGTKRVTMAVQVPTSFDQSNPCIVVAPSSGSRGVYGAIGTAAEWGLKRGCAVALTDAGKGMGLHDLGDDTVTQIDGTRNTRTAAGALANFAVQFTAAVSQFITDFPNRVALKHAHSQQNPEKDWGNDTLAAARYALYAINQEYGTELPGTGKKLRRYDPGNTLVIAASVSNGGTAVLRAAEADTEGLIDAVVAGEPGATPAQPTSTYGIQENGVARPATGYGKPLLDYFTFANLYQGCAALAPEASMGTEASLHNFIFATLQTARAVARCDALAANNLVTGTTTEERAADALVRLQAYGWTPESRFLHSSHFGAGATTQVASMYAYAYGRFPVTENLCGFSFGATSATGDPVPIAAAAKAVSYATGNGVANGTPAGVIINDPTGGGGKLWNLATSASTGAQDLGFDAALCLRALVTGNDPRSGAALPATATAQLPSQAQSDRVRAGINETLAGANLRGKPALVVSGRSDALLPVNNTSRAYVAASRVNEGAASRLSYVEVLNGQHFDAFLTSFSGYGNRYVPLHAYFVDGLNAMWAHLKSGTPLPPSQVVRAVPRGGTPPTEAPAISRAVNLPPIVAAPAAADAITFSGNAINVPN